MPPEPLPWDRKDEFIRERKHERTPEAFGSAASRWRNSSSTSYSSHYASRDFSRWGFPDFRRPSGHGKQGGLHLFEEKSGHGFAPSRSCERMFGDETYRPTFSRGDLKYGRSSRDGRVTFTQRDWKSHSWEMNNGSINAPGRAHDMNIDHRSVDSMPTCPLNSYSDPANMCDQVQSKVQHDSKTSNNNGLNSGHRCEREISVGSLDWKPLKWTRSGSLSSRGSGFSHSSSSKSLGAVDSIEPKDENPLKNATPVQSPSGNAPCVTSAAPSEEATSRKKPRLGWGEGLAKYEKKKVEGPDVIANKAGLAASANSSEAVHSMSSNLFDKSPKVMGSLDCASPVTPSSIAWSSSPGAEVNSFGKAAYADNGTSNCVSPGLGSQNHLVAFPFNLEKLDDISMAKLVSSLNELLQCANPGSLDSGFVQSITTNKLLVWKGDVLKALEMTESEIDLLENELKGLKFESGSVSPCPSASSSLPFNDAKLTKESEAASTWIPQPTRLQIHSCVDEMDIKAPACGTGLGEINVHAKGEDHGSPGTATSKPCQPISLVKNTPSNSERHMEGFRNTVELQFLDSVPSSNKIHVSVSGDGSIPVKGDVVTLDLRDSSSDGKEDDRDSLLCGKILACNRGSAREASEVFNKLLPENCSFIGISGLSNVSVWDDNPLIKQKVTMRRQSLRFKERVLAIKYKGLLNLWREDTRLQSVSKYRAKSQKRFDLGLRAPNGCFQKHRTFTRSRLYSPEGILSLVPDGETFNITSKLLSDFQTKPYRDFLKMPALIVEEKEKMIARFISGNGLMEDPCAVEKEKAMINPWTTEEREIFMDKFATYGKDFRKIASFLDHKTTADCVEFYYKRHKSYCFGKIKKLGHSKQGKSAANTYLVASGKKWNREINAASLDILGAVSVMAANRENTTACRSSSSGRILLGKGGDWKSQRVDSARKRSSISDVTLTDDATCSDDSCEEMDPGGWTDEERCAFIQAFASHGKDFARISRCVRTRSQDQCRIFFSKARKCLGLDSMHVSMKVGTSVGDDVDGDGSDLEDACVLQSSSIVCNDKLQVNIDEQFSSAPLTGNKAVLDQLGPVKRVTDLNGSEVDNGIGILDQKKAINTIDPNPSEMVDKPEVLIEEGCSGMNGDSVHPIQPVQQGRKASVDCEDKQDPPIAAHGVSFPTVTSVTSLSSDISVHTDGSVEVAMEISRKEPEEKPIVPETSLNGKASEKGDASNLDQDGVKKDANVANTQDDATHSSGLNNCGNLHLVPIVPETSLNGKASEKGDASNLDQDGVKKDANVANTQDDATHSSGLNNCGNLHLVPNELRRPVPLLPKENAAAVKLKSPDPAIYQVDKKHEETLSTFNPKNGKKGQEIVRRADHKQHVSVNPLVNHIDSSQILRGYPLQIPTKKETDADATEVKNNLRSDAGTANPHLAQGFYFRKCNGSTPNGSMAEHSVFSQREQKSGLSRTHSCGLSDTEKTFRSGDVKLFGKILTSHEKEDNGTSHLRQNGRSSSATLNFAGHQNVDGNRTIMKFDQDNRLGIENVPIRSYGFWDGNRIQTGFSSLPDSAILLAKCPTAFANYSGSSSKMEQQSLQSAIKCNEHNLNGSSIYPPRAQAFNLGRDIIFSEMQRRNGFESMSSLQQQGRGIVGMNVTGAGGVLVGGVCPAVSDPVAAIKMHYARTEQYSGGQNGNVLREEETWKGKGEVGR